MRCDGHANSRRSYTFRCKCLVAPFENSLPRKCHVAFSKRRISPASATNVSVTMVDAIDENATDDDMKDVSADVTAPPSEGDVVVYLDDVNAAETSMSFRDMQKLLRAHDMSTRGKKHELWARIREHKLSDGDCIVERIDDE